MSHKSVPFKHRWIIEVEGISKKFPEDSYTFMEGFIDRTLSNLLLNFSKKFKTLKIQMERETVYD